MRINCWNILLYKRQSEATNYQILKIQLGKLTHLKNTFDAICFKFYLSPVPQHRLTKLNPIQTVTLCCLRSLSSICCSGSLKVEPSCLIGQLSKGSPKSREPSLCFSPKVRGIPHFYEIVPCFTEIPPSKNLHCHSLIIVIPFVEHFYVTGIV